MRQSQQLQELKIAIPTANGLLAGHFGHCEHFTLFDVQGSNIVRQTRIDAPPHEPGAIPKWLKAQGADVIIAGGMGVRAQQFFAQYGIKVLVGAPSVGPEAIVRRFIDGTLQTGSNTCDSEHEGGGGGCGSHGSHGRGRGVCRSGEGGSPAD
jgi:ATP-binding protein involved in chromosome partitioning